uniref:Transmembrane protein n=1 Tax=Fagus sylvatica TaxID=28930 RepID=A0A2N9H008_FAGSY
MVVVAPVGCDLGFGFLGWLCHEWVFGCGGFAGMVVVGLGLSAWVCGGGGSCGGRSVRNSSVLTVAWGW